ncbi:MAG: hypothetical protein Q7J68_07455 [Thermoplasmata archaeon]|nr:hypothetical protein [Thermoplasmata archaeon]
MMAAIIVLVYGFLMGLRRGASSCLALCMPSLVPTLIENGGDWKKGVKIALWFNAPRIVFLTILGFIIGAGGFLIGSEFDFATAGSNTWLAGYVIIGSLMFVYGLYVFANADEKLNNLAEGKSPESECKPKHPLFSKMRFATPKSRSGLLLWGGIVSIACIGETVLSLETIFVGISGSGMTSPLSGALLGGSAFFLFSVGASLPSLGFAGLGTNLAKKETRQKRLLQAERISGVLMILFGAIFISTLLIFN